MSSPLGEPTLLASPSQPIADEVSLPHRGRRDAGGEGERRTEGRNAQRRPTFRAPAFVRFVVWLPLFTLRGRRQHGLLANIPYNNQRGRGGGRGGKGLGKCSRKRKTGERPFYWTLLLLYLQCRRACNARNAILFVFLAIIVRAIN